LFVDGDDVRCPETGKVHPEFIAILEQLGISYADISLSKSGVHVVYQGHIPLEGVTQAAFAIDDEPLGANDDIPEVEIYPNKHVCIATGEHVRGSGTEVNQVNTDALTEILEEHGFSERDPISAGSDIDISNHSPNATTSNETTEEIKDLFAALDRIDARRVASDTIAHRWNDNANTSGENRAFAPSWGINANGTANIVNEEIWQDTGGSGYGGPDVMAAIDCRDLPHDERTQPRDLTGEEWFRALEHLRELGYEIPELENQYSEGEYKTFLPRGVRNLAKENTGGWNWRHNDQSQNATLSMNSARERTTTAIKDAFTSSDRVLIEALPTLGKSYGSIKAAKETGEKITFLTGRGEKEQYEQVREWCEERGLDYYTLPSFTRDCDTANGEHGEEWKRQVTQWYDRGATPQTIHKHAEDTLGRPLPCQEHKGERCPYASKWDFNPDNYDVLIGHYTHAHKKKVTAARAVVLDEFPGEAYEETLGANGMLEGAVSSWLSRTEEVPYEDYTDLIENRDNQQRRADTLLWFEETDTAKDELAVLEDANAHAHAPTVVFALLTVENLGNGFERTVLSEDGRQATYDRHNGELNILTPPDLEYASGIVALDGTPTLHMWECCLGERLNHRRVLTDAEREEYIREVLNLNLIKTSDYIKPYNSDSHVNVRKDAALLNEIQSIHGEKPGVVTTSTAENEYQTSEEHIPIAESKHYGNVLGSNEFKSKRVGAVIGSNHYGDQFIKKWSAYCGETVERGQGKGSELDYGSFGNQVLRHMREHDTLQAAMRFGRDGNGAAVYTHTNTLPDWVPIAGEGQVTETWSKGMRSVMDAVENLESASTAEVAAYPGVNIKQRQVFEHLETLRDKGVLHRERDSEDGRRFVWFEDELHRVGEHGTAELPPVDLSNEEEVTETEVDALSRMYYYTCQCRKIPESGGEESNTDTHTRDISSAPGDMAEVPPPGD
jgi:hypothetical protein